MRTYLGTVVVLLPLLFVAMVHPASAEKAQAVFFSKSAEAGKRVAAVGEMRKTTAAFEDTLLHLARINNLGFVEMRAANPEVDPWFPGEGTDLIIPSWHLIPDAPQDGIIINLPEMRMFIFNKSGAAPITHPIGIGREGLNTPTGQTKVTWKKEGPTWRPTARMREENPELPESIGPGPENPLGTHALYLGWPEYLIHGTNKPWGIGRRVSSGCIRMYPEDVTEVYKIVQPGTPVYVLDQPIKLAWIDDVLYLEAHPSIEQVNQIEESGGYPEFEIPDDLAERLYKAVEGNAKIIEWDEIRNAVKKRPGYPVAVAWRGDKTKTP